MKNPIFAIAKMFIKIYVLVLTIFFVYRLVLFIVEFKRLGDATSTEVLKAFVMGIRFDIVISGYILIAPFFIQTVASYFSNIGKPLKTVFFWVVYIIFSLAFMISAADIPYFSQFYSRFNYHAFQWMDSPVFVIKMIFQEPRYWFYFVFYILTITVFFVFLKRIVFNSKTPAVKKQLYYSIPFSLVILSFIFFGIRGRLNEKSPIRIGTAYFSANSFINQLGLNPNFTFLRSFLDNMKNNKRNYMDNNKAIENLHGYFGIEEVEPGTQIGRRIDFRNEDRKNYNVIIVIMESMSAYYLNHEHYATNLVPFLSNLSDNGLYFENCYSAGIHTHNGIFSTLYSLPAISGINTMKDSRMLNYFGLPGILRDNNYSTIFFLTHDAQFDNAEGFLRNNHFEQIISKKNYPSEKIKTTLGVPDDYMFQFSIPMINQLYNTGDPFLAVLMTSSNHGPYYLPDYYKPRSNGIKNQIVEYSDWSIEKFMSMAKKEVWFDSTIFVFIADHGAPIRYIYDISLDYTHSPLIFYAPAIITKPQKNKNIAAQIDVFPTLMGLLKIPWVNNSMGIDLLNENRQYAFFNSHDKYGVIDDEWLLIYYPDRTTALYKYRNDDKTDYSIQEHETTERMKTYLLSHLQVFLHLY